MNEKTEYQLALAELELAKIRATLTILAANAPDLELKQHLDRAHDEIDGAQDRIVIVRCAEVAA